MRIIPEVLCHHFKYADIRRDSVKGILSAVLFIKMKTHRQATNCRPAIRKKIHILHNKSA